MRLTAICNGPKRIISVSGGLEFLQTVSEPNIGQYASKDTGPQGSGLKDLTLVGEGNRAFLIRVWKLLPNRHVLKL